MKSKNFIEGLFYSPVLRAIVVFISGAWIILEISEYLIENFGIPESLRKILLWVLLCAIPVVIIGVILFQRKQSDSEELIDKDEGKRQRESKSRRSFKLSYLLVPGILLILAVSTTLLFRIQKRKQIKFALDVTLPALQANLEQDPRPDGVKNWDIHRELTKLREMIKENPTLDKTWYDRIVTLSIVSDPPGARVFATAYAKPDTVWQFLGHTPLNQIDFSRGVSRIRLELEGRQIQYDVLNTEPTRTFKEDSLFYRLLYPDDSPENMVYVPGNEITGYGTYGVPDRRFESFWVDRYEVTNQEYKAFVDAGAYKKPEYWNFPFVFNGDTLDFSEAMQKFKDETGRSGPAHWELGDIPEGLDELPVVGVSWYEAAAYAEFKKKALPTIFHWYFLSVALASEEIVKFGNFHGEGLNKAGSNNSLTRYGTFDLAGNASEWIYNPSGANRFVNGGNYLEPSYFYNSFLQISPWTRNNLLGFRCLKYVDGEPADNLLDNIGAQKRDYAHLEPVSDAVFQIYKGLLEVPDNQLDPVVLSADTTEDWVLEKIVLQVPYDEPKPFKIHLYLPVNQKPPYQTVLYFPGLGSHQSNTENNMRIEGRVAYFIRSGRALIWPQYYATHGRGETNIKKLELWKQTYKNIIADVNITLDYLESHEDFDPNKVAFYGSSWGGAVAPYILAVEDRIQLGMLKLFGIPSLEKYRFKEFDQLDYVPRIKIPMLLLGGKYDPDCTMEQQQAFYDFLGTPKTDVKWLTYETTHWVPRKDLINETLSWLDHYFGPVQ